MTVGSGEIINITTGRSKEGPLNSYDQQSHQMEKEEGSAHEPDATRRQEGTFHS